MSNFDSARVKDCIALASHRQALVKSLTPFNGSSACTIWTRQDSTAATRCCTTPYHIAVAYSSTTCHVGPTPALVGQCSEVAGEDYRSQVRPATAACDRDVVVVETQRWPGCSHHHLR